MYGRCSELETRRASAVFDIASMSNTCEALTAKGGSTTRRISLLLAPAILLLGCEQCPPPLEIELPMSEAEDVEIRRA